MPTAGDACVAPTILAGGGNAGVAFCPRTIAPVAATPALPFSHGYDGCRTQHRVCQLRATQATRATQASPLPFSPVPATLALPQRF